MSDKRILVVGAGTMGSLAASLIGPGRVQGVELVGVVDVAGAKAEAVASGFGVSAFDSVARAITETRPDAAYVATPDALHREPVEALANSGVAILVEKPLATTIEDANAMVDAVERAGVYAEVNYSNRWNPPFVAAYRAIESGELGDVRFFNARLNNPLASPRDHLAWSGNTTSAWFLMSHCLDLAYWLGRRKAVTVFATGDKRQLAELGINTFDWIHATVRYDGGSDGVFESAWNLPDAWPAGIEFNFRILGSAGSIEIDNTRQNIAVTTTRVQYPETLSWEMARIGAFIRAMDGEGHTRVSFRDGLETTRILVAIHRSLETGNVEQV